MTGDFQERRDTSGAGSFALLLDEDDGVGVEVALHLAWSGHNGAKEPETKNTVSKIPIKQSLINFLPP